ncbi:hypothetical protein JCM10450v2_002153 [Rhodotorula kratochvilovae]
MATALVFGANGVSGIAMLEALSATPDTQWKKIIAVSRRAPVLEHKDPRIVFESVDLLADKDEVVAKLKHAGAEEATHTFFYAYVAKEEEQELVDVNRKLFSTAIEAVAEVAPNHEVFQLQTGYKYYGTHRGGKDLAPYPWKADSPRHEGQNFYYEDMLKEACAKHGWKWIVTRPNFIVGVSKGNFMSLATTIALYAAGRKALGEPLVFPGSSLSWELEYDHSSASNNAAFQLYAALNEQAANRTFNIHDSKPSTFAQLWPKIADYFGVPLASPPADLAPSDAVAGSSVAIVHPSTEWAFSHSKELQQWVKAHDLDPRALDYATWDFLDFATARTWADIATLDEARSIGWDKSVDTFEEGYRKVFDQLKKAKVIPV